MDADQIKAAWSLVSRIEGVPWPTGGDALDAACALRALLGEVERLLECVRVRDEHIKREAVLERAFAVRDRAIVLLCEEINGCANHSLTSAFEACASARAEMAEEGGV